ncbi:MAG: hypothetical protein Q7T11_05470, partial [Deltaproteobacteria bacterium]|nr:hypothetical protein [Deltaproteobacteria bacterium]
MKFFAGMTVAVFFLAFPASDIRADSQNYQNYVVGERAAGMGGAYTAFSDSAEGTLYNPGGIVFAPDDTISLSGNIIRYTTGTVEGGLVINPTTSKDVKISDMKVTPASSVGLKKFKKQALALSFYKPDATNYSGQEEL